MKIKGFIEVTDSKSLEKKMVNVDEIKLIENKKIFIFNVYFEILEEYEDLKKLIIDALK